MVTDNSEQEGYEVRVDTGDEDEPMFTVAKVEWNHIDKRVIIHLGEYVLEDLNK